MPRPKAIKHVGVHASRLKWNNPRELAFARQWEKENKNGKILWHLSYRDNTHSLGFDPLHRNITQLMPYDQNSATVAATVVQWLGSNVGLDFVRISLDKCGYKIVRKEED
jgi:hypothetical protein